MFYTDDAFTSDPADVDSLHVHDDTRFCYACQYGHIHACPFCHRRIPTNSFVRLRGRCIDQQTNTTLDLEDPQAVSPIRSFTGTLVRTSSRRELNADGAGKRWYPLDGTA